MDEPLTQFDELYEEYGDAIFRHLYFRLGSREPALDLTQEVFAGLWKQLSGGGAIEQPRAYLYRSAHNAFVNEIARTKRDLSLDQLADVGFDPADEGQAPEAEATGRELVGRVQEVPEPYRTALVLRYVDGMRVKDIAELTGEQENTISVRVKRGIEQLKKLYGPV